MSDDNPFAAVARRVVPDGRLLRSWPLEGGVSAIMHGLEIRATDGSTRRVVVRRHDAKEWKPHAANVTATEFALLEALRGLGMAVPVPRSLDESGEILPTPYFVMDFVEGTTAVSDAARPDAIREMADFLTRLHALDVGETALPELPEREDPRDGALEYLPRDAFGGELRAMLRSEPEATTPPPRSLVHGDFWPENVMWRDGSIAAVLDWEDAAIGDPLSDLACCRSELLCHYDAQAMDSFTEHYCASASVDAARLSLWELYASAAALATMGDWGLDPEVEARRRGATQWFMEQAGHALLERAAQDAPRRPR
jgi:aminoglycoside phosphotransferase (APT) family kinase protein